MGDTGDTITVPPHPGLREYGTLIWLTRPTQSPMLAGANERLSHFRVGIGTKQVAIPHFADLLRIGGVMSTRHLPLGR